MGLLCFRGSSVELWTVRREAAFMEGMCMSEQTVEVEKPDEVAPEVEAAKVETEDEQLGAGGIKALKAEREARSAAEKELAEARARVQEFEYRDKSAEQKQAEEAERLRAEIAELTQAKTLAEVSNTAGVPADLLAGPKSSSVEDVQAYADALSEWRGTQQPVNPVSAVVPTIGQVPQRAGNVPLSSQIAAAEAAGDKETVAALKAMQLGSV